MPRNGSGVYSLPAGNPVITGTIISSSWANTTLQDIANALTQSQARDGQTPITGNLDMDGFHHTNVGDATAGDQYAVVHQVQESAYTWCGVAGGTADAITLAPTPGITEYVAGQRFQFEVSGSNTTAVTVSVSGLTAKQLVKNAGVPLVPNDLIANSVVEVIFAGDDKFHLFGAAGTDNTFSNVDITNDLTVGGDTTVHNLTVDGGTLNFTNGGDIDLPDSSVDPSDLSPATLALIAALAGSSGAAYSIRGFAAMNNVGTPNTQFDMHADTVVVADPATNATAVITSVPSITVNVSTAGPIINGRDQAGAFSANSFVHFYYIYDGITLSGISSAAGPNVGPTLPTGYTKWAYACSVLFNASSHLAGIIFYGSQGFFTAVTQILTNGTATSSTPVDVSVMVPAEAVTFGILAGITITTTSVSTVITFNSHYTGTGTGDIINLTYNGFGPSLFTFNAPTGIFPNVDQKFYYYTDIFAGTGPLSNAYLIGYQVPNGDS